jgi:Mn-dependent DtxR family transcriptional regulator
LKRLLLRALNKNQILILYEIENNSSKTVTSLLRSISRSSGIPLSTLKLNARILKNLELIDFGDYSTVQLTEFGRYVMKMIKCGMSEVNKNDRLYK